MDQPRKLAEIRIPAKSSQLQRMRDTVRGILEQQRCFTSQTVHCVVLAVDEACSNIIRHAYGRECDNEIVLEIFSDRDDIVFRLTDFANPVDIRAVTPRQCDHLAPGGLGMHIIHQVMDKTEFVECPECTGNVLVMRKRTDRA